MKKILPILLVLIANISFAQTVSIRLSQASYSAVDPDGAGPATGSVTIQFELMASSGGVLADGMGLSFLYQSSVLTPTPTNTTTAQGPVASSIGWSQNVDNRLGTDVSVTYGGRTFNKRMIITFQQAAGIPNAPIPTSFTQVAQVTYWTLGGANPQGGYATPEPGSILPQNALSSDGGLTSYDYLSPNLTTPLPLGNGPLPVLITKFDASCTNNGSLISWATSSEFNSDYFEVQRSSNGNDWLPVASIKALGTSSTGKAYQQLDIGGGNAFYRIKQVDLDGHFIYTNVARTSCERKNIEIVMYPVPAHNILNVVIRSDRSIKTQLNIYDGSGKLVKKLDAVVNNGINNLNINLKGIAAGEYIIRSTNAELSIDKRFTIVR